MAAVFLPGNLQDEATCSVCLEFFKDPVSIECGHNFCRTCIVKSWKDLEMDFPCPQCREVFQQKSLRPNRQLANMSEIISQFALRGAKGAEEDGLCVKHREALKLYCKDDRRSICVVCDRSREHRPHAVVPVDEASEEYKVPACLSVCPPGAQPIRCPSVFSTSVSVSVVPSRVPVVSLGSAVGSASFLQWEVPILAGIFVAAFSLDFLLKKRESPLPFQLCTNPGNDISFGLEDRELCRDHELYRRAGGPSSLQKGWKSRAAKRLQNRFIALCTQ